MVLSMTVIAEIGAGELADLIKQVQAGDEVLLTQGNKPVAKLVPIGRAPRTVAQRRQAALAALQAFEPIAVPGATLAELIAQGRR